MKKIFAVLMVAILVLALCACGGRDKVREAAATAPELDMTEYLILKTENEAKAEAEYDGNIYRYTGYVVEIKDDYCTVGYYHLDEDGEIYGDGVHQMTVYLEQEDLVKLSTREIYTFAGEFECDVIIPNFRNAILIEE